MKATKTSKMLKARVIKFALSKDIEGWTIRISKKALEEGVNIYGETDLAEKDIIINPFKANFVLFTRTLIHEILHGLRATANEQTVLRWEKQIWYDMSPVEKTQFINGVFNHIIWDE